MKIKIFKIFSSKLLMIMEKMGDSMQLPEVVPNIEQQEEFEALRKGAENVLSCFALKRSPDNKKGENLLIVTDAGADDLMIKALWEAGRKIAGDDCRVVVASKTEHAAQDLGQAIGEKMLSADAVLLFTSLSRSHSEQTSEVAHPHHDKDIIASLLDSPALEGAFPKLRARLASGELDLEGLTNMLTRRIREDVGFPSKARLISITNTSREILTKGAALEDQPEMRKRIDKFAEIMQDVERVRLTSQNGTDIVVDIKKSTTFKENGVIDQPGQLSNFPMGEYSSAADLTGTSGVYVVDGAVGMIGRVKEPIKIYIENGLATKIEGGESAEQINQILAKAQQEHNLKNPEDKTTSAFKVAEISFGMNSQAFRYENSGERISPPTSLEGEKGLGTTHIALGKNSLFNIKESDPDYNNIPIHIDFVAMRPSVTGIKKDGSEIELVRDGKVVCLESEL